MSLLRRRRKNIFEECTAGIMRRAHGGFNERDAVYGLHLVLSYFNPLQATFKL
jgi:hypothetical protein